MSEQEKNSVIANDKNWRYEGEVFCVFTQDSGSGTKPVYRFWSDNFRHHFYTSDVAERDFTIKYDKNWRYEGEAWRIKGENYQASTTKKVKSALMASKMNYPADTAYTREIDQSVLESKAAQATSEATAATNDADITPSASRSATLAQTDGQTETADERAQQTAAPQPQESQEQETTAANEASDEARIETIEISQESSEVRQQ